MSATIWLVISIIGFSLAGVALIIAVFMFINQNIPSVIGDLTGKTVAREIKAMREFNKKKGDRRFRPSDVNLARGTLTEKVEVSIEEQHAMAEAHLSKRLDKRPQENLYNDIQRKNGTVDIDDSELTPTDVLNDGSSPTEVLSDNTTEVLTSNYTDVLIADNTDVLSEGTEGISENTEVLSDGTMVLNDDSNSDEDTKPVSFKVIKEKTIISSEEVIE